MALSKRQQSVKDRIVQERGYWHPFHEALLWLDVDFLEAYLGANGASVRANVLPPKVREFIYVAVDGSVNHLYEKGLERHINDALDAGATPGELMEVIQITCSLVRHTNEMGMAVLMDELKAADPARAGRAEKLDDNQAARKRAFTERTGYWPDGGDALLNVSPEFAPGFLNFLSRPYERGDLEPKVREFIFIALNAAPTTLYAPAVRQHIKRALELGATKEEIADVLQCASAIGIHSATYAMPHLYNAMKKRGLLPPGMD